MRIGERFTLVLTCRLAETPAETAVVDRSGLDPKSIQLSPFEVLDGSAAVDVQTDTARFFQYEYTLRLLDDLWFNGDVAIPPIALSYRIQTQTDNADAIRGIERTYSLPPQSVHILSLVPDEATDIRDASAITFREVERAASRTDVLVVCGIGLVVIGCVFGFFGVTRLVAAGEHRTVRAAVRWLPLSAVLRGVALELAAVRRERLHAGWTPALEGRALVALRILAGVAAGFRVSQRPDVPSGRDEGTLRVRSRLRTSRFLVSSSITPQAMVHSLALGLTPTTPPRDQERLHEMLAALAAFTRARYGRGNADNDADLDASLAAGERVAGKLTWERRLRFETLRRVIRPPGEVRVPR